LVLEETILGKKGKHAETDDVEMHYKKEELLVKMKA